MPRHITLIVVLSVVLVLLITFAVLYYTGVIPGSPGTAPARSTGAVLTPSIAIIIILLAVSRKRRKERNRQEQ